MNQVEVNRINPPVGWTWSNHGQPWLNPGWTMVSDHGWPWSGNVLTMVEPWLTMVMLNGHHCQPWLTMVMLNGHHCQPLLTMVRQPWSDHGQPWSVPHSKIKWPCSLMVKYLMTRHSNQYPWGWTWLNHGQPWLTMVWQCFDHSWTMVDHGHVRSGNHGQLWSVPHSKIKWPWSVMVKYLMSRHSNQYPWGWTWVNHGWSWSG